MPELLDTLLEFTKRRVAEAEMRTAAWAAEIVAVQRVGDDFTEAEAALYREMDTLKLLRDRLWTLQGLAQDQRDGMGWWAPAQG